MESQKLISKEAAETDFFRWLNNFGFEKNDFNEGGQLSSMVGLKDRIIQEIENGKIEITSDCFLIQKLKKPIQSESGKSILEELKYKPDYQAYEQNQALKGIDLQKDSAKVSIAMASMLTGNGTAILGKLYSFDNKILQSVVSFFSV